MLKDFTISNLLDLNETIAAELFEGKTYPWEVLPEIGEFIMKIGPTLSTSEYECHEGNIWIGTKENGIYLLKKKSPDSYSVQQFTHQPNMTIQLEWQQCIFHFSR